MSKIFISKAVSYPTRDKADCIKCRCCELVAAFRALALGEGTNSARLFTHGEREALAMTSQTAPDWQLQIGESGASSRYNFNMELERLVCKQTALAA